MDATTYDTLYYLLVTLAVMGSLFFVGGLIAFFFRKKVDEKIRKKFTVLSVVVFLLGFMAVALPIFYTVYLQIDLTSTADSYELSLEGMAEAGDYEGVEALLIEGTDPDQTYQPEEGNAPILCAAINGDKEMVELLLEYGADINAVDFNGETALFFAATDIKGTDMLEFLIENGADVTHKSDQGVTAAHVAAAASNLDAVKLLHKSGADMTALSTAGYSIIYYACTPGSNLPSKDLLEYLVDCGADLTYENSAGKDLAEILKESQTNYIALHAEDEDFDNDKQNDVYGEALKYMEAKVSSAQKSAEKKKK